jgi:dihydrofolate reductase
MMRKIVLLEHVSLDGYMADANGNIRWIRFNDELAAFGHKATDRCDAVIYGRKTYEMAGATEHEKSHSAWVNLAERYVVSRSLQSAPWGSLGDCTVISDIHDFTAIKDRPGRDMVLIGSIDTARTLIDAGLVDEYYLTLNPVILGGGRRQLDEIHGSIDLQLADSQTFSTGVVACHYVKA